MVIRLDLKEIEKGILNPLNEILLLSYGTEIYHEILKNIERIVKEMEDQHSVTSKSWQ